MYLILTLGTISFLLCLIFTPLIRDAFVRRQILDYPDHLRHFHSHPTPRIGGVGIALSYVLAFIIGSYLPFSYGEIISRSSTRVWTLCLAAALVFFSGLLDDLIGLKPWQKLLEQFFAASMAYLAGVRISLFSEQDGWASVVNFVVSVAWIIGCTNAINLIDGVDGLAAGVGLFATITVVISALTSNNTELALVTIPLAGALLAFLRYNFNPASVFLGDSGSLLVGFLLGCYGVLWSQKSATVLGMTAPLMAMAIPLLDAGLAVVRRFIRHQPIFEADRGHIHHKLLDRGWTPRRVALFLYGACGCAAAFSLLQHVTHNQFQGLIVLLFCIVTWVGVQHLGYSEFSLVRQIVAKGTLRRLIDSQSRLQALEKDLADCESFEAAWRLISTVGLQLGFSEPRFISKGDTAAPLAGAPEGEWMVAARLAGGTGIRFQRSLRGTPNPVDVDAFLRIAVTALNAASAVSAKTAPGRFEEQQHAGSAVS